MKTLFITAKEIQVLKSILSCSTDVIAKKILQKVEKLENCGADYSDLLFQVYKEAHREVISYFREYNIKIAAELARAVEDNNI